MRNTVAALMLALFACAAQAQQIYKWVDANGKVRYTAEKPPAGVQSKPLENRVQSYSGTPAVSRAPAVRSGVTMYATAWCGYCKQARQHFARGGIRYTELDIEKSAAAEAEYKRLGGKGVPVILVGSQRMDGYGEAQLAQMLKAAGY